MADVCITPVSAPVSKNGSTTPPAEPPKKSTLRADAPEFKPMSLQSSSTQPQQQKKDRQKQKKPQGKSGRSGGSQAPGIAPGELGTPGPSPTSLKTNAAWANAGETPTGGLPGAPGILPTNPDPLQQLQLARLLAMQQQLLLLQSSPQLQAALMQRQQQLLLQQQLLQQHQKQQQQQQGMGAIITPVGEEKKKQPTPPPQRSPPVSSASIGTQFIQGFVGGNPPATIDPVSPPMPQSASADSTSKKATTTPPLAPRQPEAPIAPPPEPTAPVTSGNPLFDALRRETGHSLRHLTFDQRQIPKRYMEQCQISNVHQYAQMMFVIEPTAGLSPRVHDFTDLSPNDICNFHRDLGAVLKKLKKPTMLHLEFGEWRKSHSNPFMYLSCEDYKSEVEALCPDVIPNAKKPANYGKDSIRNVTKLIVDHPSLNVLTTMSLENAMFERHDISEMYVRFYNFFKGLQSYEVQMVLGGDHAEFLVKTDKEKIPKSGVLMHSKGEIHWDDLPHEEELNHKNSGLWRKKG